MFAVGSAGLWRDDELAHAARTIITVTSTWSYIITAESVQARAKSNAKKVS
jgi:hypothetical protein